MYVGCSLARLKALDCDSRYREFKSRHPTVIYSYQNE